MSDDRFTLMSPGQTRKASPPVPAKTPPPGASRERALGNAFLGKAYTTISMEFDGTDLIVYGDGAEVLRTSAQSGRPVVLREQDAKAAGANPVTDTYMNDKRFVGVKDYGPIPEGAYTFRPSGIERYDFAERMKLQLGGVVGAGDVTVQGRKIHAGDWGTGRVALTPNGPLRQGPIGDVSKRDGFYLHGGLLAGSSGCIDVGGDFDEIAELVQGYPKPVTVTVRYRNEPPVVGVFTGASGALAYGRAQLQHGPSAGLGAEFGAGGPRALASAGYDLVLQWAGGALRAGVRLDVPFTDQSAFVRAGVGGGLDFRLFRPLYGRLVGGYSWDLSGPDPRQGPELGGGLRLDLGRTRWEALYQVLRPAAERDQQVHQALLKLGFRF